MNLEAARAVLSRSSDRRQRALAENQPFAFVESEWKRAVENFRQQIAALNKRIFDYNLQAPVERFQGSLVDVEREIETIAC